MGCLDWKAHWERSDWVIAVHVSGEYSAESESGMTAQCSVFWDGAVFPATSAAVSIMQSYRRQLEA